MELNNKGGWSFQATRIHEIQWTSLSFLLQCTVNAIFTADTAYGILASTLHFNSRVPYVSITLRCYLTVRFPNLFCYKVIFFRLFFEKNQVVILLVAACLLS